MAVVSLLVGAIWAELWVGLAGVLAGAVFATVLPRLATAHRGAGDWIPLRWRRLALAVHGAVIIREIWRLKHPGTCRAFVAACHSYICGNGFNFKLSRCQAVAAHVESNDVAELPTRDSDNWYVNDKDLAFFQYHAEQNGPTVGASDWQVMMDKDVPNVVRYTAWRRTLPGGKSEYKSVTLCPDATAQEFNDLYFDDDFRVNWDEMVVHHEVLEYGDFAQRQQVVKWIRRFPFAFLTDREYTIARRSFQIGDSFYGLTKAINHPKAPANGQVVHMDVFHSMWESHDIPCPWGSGKPACQTTLLHHEQFKISEHLARFAVRMGMWNFVKKLSEEVPKFIADRRTRAGPHEVDPQAYGAGVAPNPPSLRRGSTTCTNSSCTLSSMASSLDLANTERNYALQARAIGHRLRSKTFVPRAGAFKRLRGAALVAVVTGVALIVRAHQGKQASQAAAGAGYRQRRHNAAMRQEHMQ